MEKQTRGRRARSETLDTKLHGPVGPSQCSAETTFRELMDEGYIVRWLPGQGLADGLRMTVGTEEENRGLMAALRKILERHS